MADKDKNQLQPRPGTEPASPPRDVGPARDNVIEGRFTRVDEVAPVSATSQSAGQEEKGPGLMDSVRDFLNSTGVQRFKNEVGDELKRLGKLGSFELGSALFNGEAYRGDLGLYSASPTPQQQDGHGVHGIQQELPPQDGPGIHGPAEPAPTQQAQPDPLDQMRSQWKERAAEHLRSASRDRDIER